MQFLGNTKGKIQIGEKRLSRIKNHYNTAKYAYFFVVLALEKLFGSNCRKKLLEKFFLEYTFNPKKDFFIRELCREIEEQINAVRRELENLENLGILKSRWDENTKHYSLDMRCSIMPDLQMIFGKSFDAMGRLNEYFRGKHNLSLLVVGGGLDDMTRESTNNLIDILIIGETDKENFNLFLSKHFFGRKIKYAVISAAEFQERLKFGDKLISRILHQPGNVVLKDSLGLKDIQQNTATSENQKTPPKKIHLTNK